MVEIELYSVRDGNVQPQAGLNWNFSIGHVGTCDAYIALTNHFFRTNPNFFPAHGSIINVSWDDGIEMNLLLEGTQEINNETYPKQISTYNDKSALGEYLRSRIGVPCNQRITMADLDSYGRSFVTVTNTAPNNYYFDFS